MVRDFVRDEPTRVDVWQVDVEEHRQAFPHHWQWLDLPERQRARGFLHEADRLRYVISRATLRVLLGRELQARPDRLRFGRSEFGKPFVAGGDGPHFNSSHSGAWVLHAFSNGTPVGVDVEALTAEPFELDAFDQVLSRPERQRLLELPAARRKMAFMELWVCKEAYVKAIGEGLNRNLGAISIGPLESGGYEVLDDRNPGGTGGRWTLTLLDVGPAHAACVAHPGQPVGLRLRKYTG